MSTLNLSHLRSLEDESIYILREVVAECENPVMLYSVGKDSSVMLRLAQKAFYPGKIPFPLMHVDTSFKFKEMYEFRDELIQRLGVKLIIHNEKELQYSTANPYDLGTQVCCSLLKTRALLNAIQAGGFDAAIGGGRREEEKSRAKERVFSFRTREGLWDPKNQRPELWNLYNSKLKKGESLRVFPLSNWTELDIWQYILKEEIPVVPLYFSKERDVIRRDGQIIPVVEGTRLQHDDKIEKTSCRFRTLGCHPCSGAIESKAKNVSDIIEEMIRFRVSERSTRVIDHDVEGSMEDKKREGYF